MASHSILQAQSEGDGSSALSEAKETKYQSSSGIQRLPSGTEDDSKKRGNSPLAEMRPAKRQKNIGIQKYTSMAGNDSLSNAANDLEFEIEKARFEIFNRVMNLKIKMGYNDKMLTKDMEAWTRICLSNISDGASPQNELFIKSLIDNSEEVIRNVGEESKRDADHTMNDIRKILVKLANQIKKGFRPRPCVDAAKVTRSGTINFVRLGCWILLLCFSAFSPIICPNFFNLQ